MSWDTSIKWRCMVDHEYIGILCFYVQVAYWNCLMFWCKWFKWQGRPRLPSDLDVNVCFLCGPAAASHASILHGNGRLRLSEKVLLSAPARLCPDRWHTTSEPQRLRCADTGAYAPLPSGWPHWLSSPARRGFLLPAGRMRQRWPETANPAGHHLVCVCADREGLGPDSIRHLRQLLPAVRAIADFAERSAIVGRRRGPGGDTRSSWGGVCHVAARETAEDSEKLRPKQHSDISVYC